MCRVHLGVHRPARNWPVEDYLEQCPKLVAYLQKGGGYGSSSWVCVVDHHTVLKAARIARRLVDVVGIYMCVGTDDTSSFPMTEVVLCGVTEILGWTRDFCSVAGGYCRYENTSSKSECPQNTRAIERGVTVGQAASNSNYSALRVRDGEQQQLSPNHEYQATTKTMPLCMTLSPSVHADFEDYLSHGDTECPLGNATSTWVGSSSQKLVETSSDEGYTIDELWEAIMADF